MDTVFTEKIAALYWWAQRQRGMYSCTIQRQLQGLCHCIYLQYIHLPNLHLVLWKNSAWLGTGIMIDRETPLAEIVGQMSLSRSTDVSTQSWVFISVKNMSLTLTQDWVETSVLLDNDICPAISASGVSLSIITLSVVYAPKQRGEPKYSVGA